MQNFLNHLGELSVKSYIPRAHKSASIQVANRTSFVICCVVKWFQKSGDISMCGAQMTFFFPLSNFIIVMPQSLSRI